MAYPESVDMKGPVLENFTKKRLSDFSWLVFPVFIFWLIGIVLGIWMSKTYFEYRLDDAVKMQRMVYKTHVYDLMLFDSTVGKGK